MAKPLQPLAVGRHHDAPHPITCSQHESVARQLAEFLQVPYLDEEAMANPQFKKKPLLDRLRDLFKGDVAAPRPGAPVAAAATDDQAREPQQQQQQQQHPTQTAASTVTHASLKKQS